MYALSSAVGLGVANAPRAVSKTPLKLAHTNFRSVGTRKLMKHNVRTASYKSESKTTQINTQEIQEKLNEYASVVKEEWEKSDEKPAVVAIVLSSIVGLAAVKGVIDAVDRIPVISGLLELVGITFTGWFIYRYLVFGPDREELVTKSKDFVNSVAGKKLV